MSLLFEFTTICKNYLLIFPFFYFFIFLFLFFLVEFPVLANRQPPGQCGPVQRPRFGVHVSVVRLK
jgi:hypothetical protein